MKSENLETTLEIIDVKNINAQDITNYFAVYFSVYHFELNNFFRYRHVTYTINNNWLCIYQK